jgi:hypothetical protein
MVRKPAVAGQFYSSSPDGLTKEVAQYITDTPSEPVIGAICPHAGLMYSVHVAGAVYSKMHITDTVILLGPNHTGLGQKISLMSAGVWEIPTCRFDIDEVIAHKIYRNAGGVISKDTKAHLFEHSIEVQLPFIAYLRRDVKIVPVAMMQASLEECRKTGEAISAAIKSSGSPVTIIASSDMSHYISDSEARKLDNMAIERVLELDPEGLYNTVLSKGISMCGYLPATAMLFAAISLGAGAAELVKYATSGDVSGDYSHVVGYAGIVVR